MAATRVEDVKAGTTPVATACLSLRGVVKQWPGTPAPVLDAVDLDLEPGSALAVTGRNGAGKTTLLRIAAGLISPDAGTVSAAGVDPVRDRRAFQRRIGFVSAGNGALYARLTVDHHLTFWGRLALLGRREREAAAARAATAFSLEELRGKRVDRLSTGQRQRLRLAGGFLHDPDVVLLDEPAGSLDDEAVELLVAAVEGVRGRGGAVVVCSPTGVQDALSFDSRLAVAAGRLEPA